MVFEPEQLEMLKRRAEEDFRLDMAAIERLQRRYIPTTAGTAPAPYTPVYSASASEGAEAPATYSRVEPVPASRPDELTSSLRAMFSQSR
jgi:hypothetical protein